MPLDPNSFSDLVKVYQTEIDSLIENLGKNITLYFKPTVTNVQDEFDDPLRENELRKPSYKGTPEVPAPDETQNTKIIKALIKYDPKDFEHFGLRVDHPSAVIRLKSFLTDVPDLLRCQYIKPNVNSQDIIFGNYKIIRAPIPVGLQKDRYSISYWERIG
jgi:hypothetical protein